MPVVLTLDNRQFLGHGICGNVAQWDAGGAVIQPCHGNDFIAIDDHRHANAQGGRLGPPGSGQTAGGLNYETPIDCRRLYFDSPSGRRRTFGIEGACLDLPVVINPGERLIFSWKFIPSGASAQNNSFALALAYPRPTLPAAPTPAPPLNNLGPNGAKPPKLLRNAIRIPMNGDVHRLNEARAARTPANPRFDAHWEMARWTPPAGGFTGLIRWIVCTGWRIRGGRVGRNYWKVRESRNTRVTQRAWPATLLLDCVEII
ncbi:MAG: hypothetical protein OEU92_13885 [Alphaproteobacteria bacterium]|nr:hypothetical protein [Alphaproteobacteria bacterium]